jgi:tetratricopeptide (TPR) repeat protein
VRKNWRNTISAAVCAAGMAAASAKAGPAGMTGPSGWFGASETSQSATEPHERLARSVRPTDSISPWRRPVKYFTAAMKELPIGSKTTARSGSGVLKAAPVENDPISLNTPTPPPTPEFVISLAQLSEGQGNVPQARQHYQRALAMWPRNVALLRQAARMEDRQGQYPVAENLYRQAVAADPRSAGALNDLGLCLARQGKLAASMQVIEQAVQLQPHEARYRNNAAIVLVEMQQDQQALAHLAAVHGSAEANYNLGQLLVQRGRADEAAAYFIAAVEQKPDMQSAHEALARLQGADVNSAPTVATDAPATAFGPTVVSEPNAPPTAPAPVPQQASPVGPQFQYPSTARSPEPGTSSYQPPGFHPPAAAYAPVTVPRVGARPQHVPTVTYPQSPFRR